MKNNEDLKNNQTNPKPSAESNFELFKQAIAEGLDPKLRERLEIMVALWRLSNKSNQNNSTLKQ